MLRRLILGATVLLAVAASLAARAEGVTPEPVAPEVRWEGPQLIQADGKGNVFVLRARELEVFPVLRNGSFGEPQPLFERPVEGGPPVTRAAMIEPGEWVVRQGYEVRWFRRGKELPVAAAQWPVMSVAALDGRPVVAVVPTPIGRPAPGQGRGLALLAELARDRWSSLVEADSGDAERSRMDLMQRHAAHLITDSRGTLWTGRQYRYLIHRYSPAGRHLLEISVDGDNVAQRGEDTSGGKEAALERARGRMADGERAQVHVNRAIDVIQAMAEGRDGRYYFLVHGEGEDGLALSLDRYDPGRITLERTALPLNVPGVMTMAGGRDGLYIAAFSGKNGRWRIAWEDLEAAPWSAVEGARIDGIDLPPDDREAAPTTSAQPAEARQE